MIVAVETVVVVVFYFVGSVSLCLHWRATMVLYSSWDCQSSWIWYSSFVPKIRDFQEEGIEETRICNRGHFYQVVAPCSARECGHDTHM